MCTTNSCGPINVSLSLSLSLYGHVAVCVEHYILIFGGAWRDDREKRVLLSANVIWMYNLYTEQWRKNIIPTKESPHVAFGAYADVIESVVYMFGGSKDIPISLMDMTNALWTLTRTSDGRFAWSEIVTTSNTDAPSPRCSHTGWKYLGNLWIFAGAGVSPVGYLNACGDFDT